MGRVIGIDLGTTNTCAAYVSNRMPRVVPTESGYNTLPSVVTLVSENNFEVGQAAKDQILVNPQRTIHGIKRLFGRPFRAKAVQEFSRYAQYQIVADDNGDAAVEIDKKIYRSIDIQAAILRQIKRYAEIHLGEDLPEAVIAVPAYYNDRQRSLVKQAGEIGGWNVRRVVNEPTAAALAYGFNRGFDQKILVYDLGGGTFDVSVLEITDNVFQVLATGGDIFLGGSDFDNRICDWIADNIQRRYRFDARADIVAQQRIRIAAERAKIELSLLANTHVRLEEILPPKFRSEEMELFISRDTLNALTRDLVDRTLQITESVLTDKGLQPHEIDEVILVGGQTRTPLVAESITQFFGKTPRKGIHPDECVALGAALLGDSLAKIDSVTLLDTISAPMGITTPSGQMQLLIGRHQTLPYKKTVELELGEKSGDELQIHVYQGEGESPDEADYLGTLVCGELPEIEGPAKIKIAFSFDLEGMLNIEAYYPHATKPTPLTLKTILAQKNHPVQPTPTPNVAHEVPISSTSNSSLGGFVRQLFKRS